MLHNFVIDNASTTDDDDMDETDDNETGGNDDPDDNNNNNDNNSRVNGHRTDYNVGRSSYCPSMREELYQEVRGFSIIRTTLVQYLRDNGYDRPVDNLLRNRRYIDESTNAERVEYDEGYYCPT